MMHNFLKSCEHKKYWQNINCRSEKIFKDFFDSDLTESSGVFFEENIKRPNADIFYAVKNQRLERENIRPDSEYIHILGKKDFIKNYGDFEGSSLLVYHYEENTIDNIDIFDNCVMGTFVIPYKGNILKEKTAVGFYITESKVIFVDDTDMMFTVMERVVSRQRTKVFDIAHAFVRILECMISEDMVFMQKYRTILNLMEDNMQEDVNEIPHNFTNFVMSSKKELREMMVYYRNLNYMTDEIGESEIFDGIVERRLQSFANKRKKLSAEALSLYESAQQIHDIYQSKINLKQNKVMTLLTIVTTVFMPLTLITGWYGMNIMMPEVGWKYSYIVIIALSVIITIVEISIFKRKKWF